MKYALTENEGYSLATITKPETKTVVSYLSADIHSSQTVQGRATELLYTDMLISGAGKYNRELFLDAVNSLGATISSGISDGVFTLFIRSKSDVYKKVLGLVHVMLSEPHFHKTELDRVKKTTINALKESKEDTRAAAHEMLRNTLYGNEDRRYSFSEEELILAVKKITPSELKKLHTKILHTNWTVSSAGDKDSLTALQTTVKKFKTKTSLTQENFGIHQQKPPVSKIILKDVPSKQNIDFSIGVPVPITLHHPDYLPLMFGLAVLGKWGGFAGRLMSTVREQEGLTYGIYARTETFLNEEQGYWRIMTFFAPEKSVQGLTSTFREIKKIHKEGITKAELATFKQIIETAEALKHDSTSSLLNDLHGYHLQKFSLEEIAEHKKRIAAVTLEEVNAAIERYLDPQTLTICGAGPIAKVKKDLESFMKTVA